MPAEEVDEVPSSTRATRLPSPRMSWVRKDTGIPVGRTRGRDPVVIIGAGLTGLSAAARLDQRREQPYRLVEREERPGGWAKTDWAGAWGADRAGHVLYFRHAGMRRWVERLLEGRWIRHTKRCVIDSGGVRTPFPFHANLHGRPKEVIDECLAGLVDASRGPKRGMPAATFDDWILDSYGPGVAKHFMEPYNSKMWTLAPRWMRADWMAGFIPAVDLDRAIRGAQSRLDSRVGLNAEFFYPEAGMSAVVDRLASGLRGAVSYGVSVVRVTPGANRIALSDGSTCRYRSLISTIPLPRLVELTDDLPTSVRTHAESLESVDLVLVDVGVRDPRDGGEHWAYLPDADVLGYRLSAVHNLSRRLAPARHGLYTVEVAHSTHRPLPSGSVADRVVADLVRLGWIGGTTEVSFMRERHLHNAYAIPLVGSAGAAAEVRCHLQGLGIHSVGRFGEWKYSNMEDALLDGRRVVDGLMTPRLDGSFR